MQNTASSIGANYFSSVRDKIDRKEIPEIRDRAINQLYIKLKAKLASPEDMVSSKNKKIVGSILGWINERKSQTDKQNMCDAISVLSLVAKASKKGQKLLRKYGSQEFFLEFRKNAPEDLYKDIDNLLTCLVSEGSENQTSSFPKDNNGFMISTQTSQCDEYSEYGMTTDDENRCPNALMGQQLVDTINDRDIGTKYGATFNTTFKRNDEYKETKPMRSPYREPDSEPRPRRSDQKTVKEPETALVPNNEEKKRQFTATECLSNKKAAPGITLVLEKEHCELPYITLSESDENFIMDLGVKIRYNNNIGVFSEVARDLESHLLKDFPLETFLQRTEVLNATLDKMVETINPTIFDHCVGILVKFTEGSVGLYKFLLNPYNRFSEAAKVENSREQEHIEKMYPSNDSDKWHQVKFNPDSLNSTNYDSHSLSYILCEIAIKALDCCLHEEKIGGALLLYRATLKAMTQIYKVQESDHFCDIFIKILNNINFVISSFTKMNAEKLIRNVLQAAIPALEVLNSIFNGEKYKEKEAVHPRLEIFLEATPKFQQELRKALFNCVFTEEKSQKVICEFYQYKVKVENKDEFVVQSYSRAQLASDVYENAWRYRLNMSDTEEGDITSASEFENMLSILNQVLQCVEL